MADVPGSADKAVWVQRPCRSPGQTAELRLIPWRHPPWSRRARADTGTATQYGWRAGSGVATVLADLALGKFFDAYRHGCTRPEDPHRSRDGASHDVLHVVCGGHGTQ